MFSFFFFIALIFHFEIGKQKQTKEMKRCNGALTCWNNSLSRSFRSNCVGMERRVGRYLAPITMSGNKPQPTIQYSVQYQKICAFNDFIVFNWGVSVNVLEMKWPQLVSVWIEYFTADKCKFNPSWNFFTHECFANFWNLIVFYVFAVVLVGFHKF